jgi:hypothetical protein
MIIKAVRRGGFKAFSDYLAGEGDNRYENEAVNLISDSLGAGSINGFCIAANHIAEPRRQGKYPLRNPIEHISIRTRKGDILAPEMIQGKIPELLKKLGYENCPWLLVQHIKGGEPHYHLGILRIDDKGRVPNPKSKDVCFELAQKFARELGFKPAFDGAKGSRYAQEQDHLARLWAETAKLSPAERLKKFQQAGFTPARHDKRPELVFIDRHGKPHSLHRIPALKAMGLKQADITAAFGFNKAKLAALPSVKQALAIIRRNANGRGPGSARRQILAYTRVGKVYSRSLSKMRPRDDVGDTKRSSILPLLIGLWVISRLLKHNELRPVRGQGGGIRHPCLKDFNPAPVPGARRHLKAGRASDVDYKAWGVFRCMIASGCAPEQAQKAMEAVYLEEEQRLAAEQRYLDWLQGDKPQGAQSLSGGPRDSPMRNGKLL